MPGRGYLKNDTLEIRAIVRMDAAANMGPAKDTASQGVGLAGASLLLWLHAHSDSMHAFHACRSPYGSGVWQQTLVCWQSTLSYALLA